MRCLQKNSQSSSIRDAPREPMAEAITKTRFSEAELESVMKRRNELVRSGHSDSRISELIAKEYGRSANSVNHKIQRMVKEGALEENPNNQSHFSADEERRLAARRSELMKTGLSDKAVSRVLSRENGRKPDSILNKLRNMVSNGKIPENPNRRITAGPFSEDETSLVIKKREALLKEGCRDAKIAKVLSKELDRTPACLEGKIADMVKQGKLPENPNKQKGRRSSPDEISLIERRRDELMSEGLTDEAISHRIAGETGLKWETVRCWIMRSLEKGRLNVNPNKKPYRAYDDGTIGLIAKRRTELAGAGMNDSQIARVISGEMAGMDSRSVSNKIRAMVASGELPENPGYRKPAPFSEEDMEIVIKKRAELIPLGLTDSAIAAIIAPELGRNAKSIEHKIRGLVRSGKAAINPKKRETGTWSEEDLRSLFISRDEFVAQGLNDTEIARKIAEKTGKSKDSVLGMIWHYTRNGRLQPNPNKHGRKPFSDEDIIFIRQRWQELVLLGMNDKDISKRIAKESGRKAVSLESAIRMLRKKGEIPENPNKHGGKPPESSIVDSLRLAADAMQEFGGERE